MKKTINALALLLAITILLSTPVFAADNDQIMPYSSDLLQSYLSYLFVPSGNGIQIWFEVTGTQQLHEIGALKIEIQRSADGENWTTVETYECTDYENMCATNKTSYSSYVTHYGEYGYYYRAKVTFWGRKGAAVYAPTVHTDAIYLRS